LGTFYIAANTAAAGPLVADAGSGKVFVLFGSQPYTNSAFTSIQAFRESDFTSVTGGSMPVNVAVPPTYSDYPGTSPLWRWGTNGLAFRTFSGVYSFRSNIVQDLSQTQADLQVTLAVTGVESAGSTLNVTASVTNNGPNPATNVSLNGLLPVNTGVASVKASQGYCTPATTLGCDLGTIPSGASVSVTLALAPYFAGSLDLAVNVIANEADPNQANNSASTSLTIAGSNYEPTPVLQAIAPNSAQAGSTETTLTVTGANFSPDSTVLWNGASIPTTYVDSSTLTATLSTSQLSTFGWVPVAVSSPAANAAGNQALPFTIYNVVYLSANHMLYNPYDRLLYASVNSAATQVTGNSIVTIDPLTGTIGSAVPVGSQPTFLALSDDGQALYALLSGANTVALYRPLSQSLAFSFTPTVPPSQIVTTGSPRGIAVMSGTETTIAYDTGDWGGVGIFDIDTGSQSGTLRGNLSGPYTGSGVSFLDANDLYTFDTDTTGDSLDHFVVSASGLSGVGAFSPYESTLFGFGEFPAPPSFKLKGGLAFANAGGVANPVTNPATQIGIYQSVSNNYAVGPVVEPDPSLGEVFFFGGANAGDQNPAASAGFFRYDEFSFLPTGFLPLANLSSGTNQNTAIDLVRFGTDGLALLTSAGQIYLARGPFITPQLLQRNPTPTLSSLSVTSATHGSGNLSFVVTGSNLVAGATVDWNGSPRTTTRVDATHLSVAIPASDLAAAGTASITITNPATAASNQVSFTVN
jgi:trimeric autotransporter adhesin